jgi:hypothetical protein
VKKYKRPTLHKIKNKKTVGAEPDSTDLRERAEKKKMNSACA